MGINFLEYPQPYLWSFEQQEIIAKYMAEKYSLKELRRRQNINQQQSIFAYKKRLRGNHNQHLLNAIKNLNVMAKILGRAVDIHEF